MWKSLLQNYVVFHGTVTVGLRRGVAACVAWPVLGGRGEGARETAVRRKHRRAARIQNKHVKYERL